MAIKWLKKVTSTPLDTIAKVINSFTSGDDKTKNAPSIKIVDDRFNTVDIQITDIDSKIFDSTGRITQKDLIAPMAQSGSVFKSDTVTLENGVYLGFLSVVSDLSISAGSLVPYVLTALTDMSYTDENNATQYVTKLYSCARITSYDTWQGAIRATAKDVTTSVFPLIVSEDLKTFDIKVTDVSGLFDRASGNVIATFTFLRLHEQYN